jgi:hypothetical protein
MASTDCPICYETFTNDLFINCSNNHIACCYECFSKLTDNNCPMCRNPLGGGEVRTTTTTTTTTTTIRARIGNPNNNYDSNIANLIANHRETLNNRQIAQRRRREREARERVENEERYYDNLLEELTQEENRINERRNEILRLRNR